MLKPKDGFIVAKKYISKKNNFVEGNSYPEYQVITGKNKNKVFVVRDIYMQYRDFYIFKEEDIIGEIDV